MISRQLVDPITNVPFPGNQIPASQISPVTQKLLPLLPISNSPDGFVIYDQPIRQHENQFLGRVDYYLASQRIYAKYFNSHYIQDAISGRPNLLAANLGTDLLDQAISMNHTNNFGPNLLNTFTFAYNRNAGTTSSGAPFNLSDIGVNIAGPTPPEIFM